METKRAIRERIFRLREACPDEEILRMSRSITEKIVSLPVYRKARRLLLYADYRHEVSTGYLIERAWRDGKETAFPKCIGKAMIFCRVTDLSELRPGAFGIPEPQGSEETALKDALMIMPGVAFDRQLHRIGYGGGYYDRFLSAHPDLYPAAAAFEFQVLEEVPHLPHDRKPRLLVTDKNIYLSGS